MEHAEGEIEPPSKFARRDDCTVEPVESTEVSQCKSIETPILTESPATVCLPESPSNAVVVEDVPDQASDPITTNAEIENCCAICMETEPTVHILDRHNCPRCVASAWIICESCDAQLLSRTCPICQHSYKELVLYAVDDVPQMPINFLAITNPKERYLVTMKTRFMFEVFTRTNSAVWCPDISRMYFSLPQDMSVPVAEMKFILLSIPMSAERLTMGIQFNFDSSVWDEIEREMETGDGGAEGEYTHEVDASSKSAARWHMKALSRQGARALTPLQPKEWVDIVANFSTTYDNSM